MAIQTTTNLTANAVYLHTTTTPAALASTIAAQSVCGWVKLSSTAGSQSIIGQYDGTHNATVLPTTAIQLGVRAVSATQRFVAWTWGGNVLVDSGAFTVATNVWYHIAYTCTAISGGTQTHKWYINGALITTSTNSTQVAGNLTQVFINGYPQTLGGSAEESSTQISDVRVYNRTLSDSEILTIYTLSGLRDGIVGGLVFAAPMSEQSINSSAGTVRDYSVNANNLVQVINGVGTSFTFVADDSDLNSRGAF